MAKIRVVGSNIRRLEIPFDLSLTIIQEISRKTNLVIDEFAVMWANIHDLQTRVKDLEAGKKVERKQ